MNEELEKLRNEYRKEIITKFHHKMNKETTKEFCKLYLYDYPKDLDFEWAEVYDWGNDFRTDLKLTFFSTKDPGYFCGGWAIDNIRIYALLKLTMLDNIDLVMNKYPYTEEELLFIEKENELKTQIEEKLSKERWKERNFKLNKDIKSTKFRFGKYKGKQVIEINITDKKYINWCFENIEGFADFYNSIIYI